MQIKTYSLNLEGLDSLDVRRHIVSDGLELFQKLLRLIYDSLVLQNRAVVREIDGSGLGSELCVHPLRVAVPLAEGLEGGDGLCASRTLNEL